MTPCQIFPIDFFVVSSKLIVRLSKEGYCVMLSWRVVTVVELLLIMLLVAFIWFRSVDATGVANNMFMRLFSLVIVFILYLPFLITQVVWYIKLRSKKKS